MNANRCQMCRAAAHEACTGRGCQCGCRDEEHFAWSDPPPRYRKPTGWQPSSWLLDELRAHPKRWALVAEFKSSSAAPSRIRKLRENFPPAEWELRSAKGDGAGGQLYMRWLGEPT